MPSPTAQLCTRPQVLPSSRRHLLPVHPAAWSCTRHLPSLRFPSPNFPLFLPPTLTLSPSSLPIWVPSYSHAVALPLGSASPALLQLPGTRSSPSSLLSLPLSPPASLLVRPRPAVTSYPTAGSAPTSPPVWLTALPACRQPLPPRAASSIPSGRLLPPLLLLPLPPLRPVDAVLFLSPLSLLRPPLPKRGVSSLTLAPTMWASSVPTAASTAATAVPLLDVISYLDLLLSPRSLPSRDPALSTATHTPTSAMAPLTSSPSKALTLP